MRADVEPGVSARLEQVDRLSQWERAELGRALRTAGWTYAEIAEVVPAAKSTIAGWCRDIELKPEQVLAIRRRTGSRRGIPRDTQRARRRQIAAIEDEARRSFLVNRNDPLWCLGIALYWGEGAKAKRELSVTNSDPAIHELFHRWVAFYLIHDPDIVLHLHIHSGNDEAAARSWWADRLDLDNPSFDKTFVKPEEPGRGKNNLIHGVARSRVRRSTDAWITTMAWIECLRVGSHRSS